MSWWRIIPLAIIQFHYEFRMGGLRSQKFCYVHLFAFNPFKDLLSDGWKPAFRILKGIVQEWDFTWWAKLAYSHENSCDIFKPSNLWKCKKYPFPGSSIKSSKFSQNSSSNPRNEEKMKRILKQTPC